MRTWVGWCVCVCARVKLTRLRFVSYTRLNKLGFTGTLGTVRYNEAILYYKWEATLSIA